MFVYFCADTCCEWAEVDGTSGCKCETSPTAWQGTGRCVQGKVECSAVVSVVSCSAVGLQTMPFLHKEHYFTSLAFEQ
jgi:hypothetical protein